MDLPDFDTLKRLAETDPERLDTLLEQQVAALIERADPGQQLRLRGLQFRIDCQRKLASNKLDSCIRIASMMHASFYTLNERLNDLCHGQGSGQAAGSAQDTLQNNVVQLSEYYREKP